LPLPAPTQIPHFEPGELLSPPGGDRIKTEIALGDNGTIAYINEYGELLKIMKYVGLGDTGMISAVPYTDEPRSPRNYRTSDDRLELHGVGMGLRPSHFSEIGDLRIEYVHDRWPRISYTLCKSTFTGRPLALPALSILCWFRLQAVADPVKDTSSRLLLWANIPPK
jgi:hypothetical protein